MEQTGSSSERAVEYCRKYGVQALYHITRMGNIPSIAEVLIPHKIASDWFQKLIVPDDQAKLLGKDWAEPQNLASN
jgi:hypothetical protein